MAKILAVLGSARPSGFTAQLWEAATAGARDAGVELTMARLADYSFSPCNSCFQCIRQPQSTCVLPDDMGGSGELFRLVKEANGLFLADAVHLWGPTARAHVFMERLYPLLWTGELNGLPFATISCASNQGMQHLATQELCKWAFGYGLRYIGGLSVHATQLEEAKSEARLLGQRLAEAAETDASQGRRAFADDRERYLYFLDQPWSGLIPYIENLSQGTFTWEKSLPEYGLSHGTFQDPQAKELLAQASQEFREAIRYYRLNALEKALEHVVQAGIFWTNATWREFLEKEVIGTSQPEAYRPLSQARKDDAS